MMSQEHYDYPSCLFVLFFVSLSHLLSECLTEVELERKLLCSIRSFWFLLYVYIAVATQFLSVSTLKFQITWTIHLQKEYITKVKKNNNNSIIVNIIHRPNEKFLRWCALLFYRSIEYISFFKHQHNKQEVDDESRLKGTQKEKELFL